MEQLELLVFSKIAGIGISAYSWLVAVQLIRRKQFGLNASILELAFAAALRFPRHWFGSDRLNA